jgi:hypothetical protein
MVKFGRDFRFCPSRRLLATGSSVIEQAGRTSGPMKLGVYALRWPRGSCRVGLARALSPAARMRV